MSGTLALCSSSPNSDLCSPTRTPAQRKPGFFTRLWLLQEGQEKVVLWLKRCALDKASVRARGSPTARSSVSHPPSSPSLQTCRVSRKSKVLWDPCRSATELAPGAKAAPEHPLPKPLLGSLGRASTPGRNHPDGESFYFLSIFVFSRAGLDYFFQQHKVLERLSSQRSIFFALGATFLCTGKQLFFSLFPLC